VQPWLLGVSTFERWAPRTRGTFRQQVLLLEELHRVAGGCTCAQCPTEELTQSDASA
jgi:hypothetical protein